MGLLCNNQEHMVDLQFLPLKNRENPCLQPALRLGQFLQRELLVDLLVRSLRHLLRTLRKTQLARLQRARIRMLGYAHKALNAVEPIPIKNLQPIFQRIWNGNWKQIT
jgi:hypothetical protein